MHLVTGEATDILELLGGLLGRVRRHGLAEQIVAIDEQLQKVFVLPVAEQLTQHDQLADVLTGLGDAVG
ncbi:hypothetical protein D3C85_1709630 [compost metagenome]